MILAYLENTGEEVPKGTLVTIRAALELKVAHGHDKVVGLLIGGSGTQVAAESLTSYGLDEIIYIEDSSFDSYLALLYADISVQVFKNLEAGVFLALASTRGKDFSPRVAQKLEAGQGSDVISFPRDNIFKRPMYAGNIIADVEITTDNKVVTVRGSAFDAAESSGGNTPVKKLNLTANDIEGAEQTFVSFDTVKSERPELTEADIVVSGGRAMKSSENFEQYIMPLADSLNAAIGASRAAVDSGYAPNDWQVGQTGKVVAPKLYIAIGISGAIQHLAGMKDSKTIVAINTDEEAPIFEVADYGLVADLYEAVPQLTELIKKSKG